MPVTTVPDRLSPPALEIQVWSGGQSWDLMALYQVGPEIVKVEIHRDTSYVFQCHARISAYDPAGRKFNLLATLQPPQIRCAAVDQLARRQDGGNNGQAQLLFGPDVAELLRLAALIIRPTTLPGGTH